MDDPPPEKDDQRHQTDKDQSKRRYGVRKIPVTRALCHEVKALMEAQVSLLEISRQLDIPYRTVQRASKRIEAQRIRQIHQSPSEPGRQLRLTMRVVEDTIDRPTRRDKKGQPVMGTVEGDPTPRPDTVPMTYAEINKMFKAMEWMKKLFIDAPATRKSRRASGRR
jgi:hypothetical protein